MKSALAFVCVAIVGCVGDAPPDEDPPPAGETDPMDGIDTTPDVADAIAGCSAVSSVVLYSESTNELTLPTAFAAAADRCTQYYVYLPALTSDKTQVRADADRVHALGANFHAMAEFHWGAWHDWVAASPGTRDWELAGKALRTRMAAAGYNAGDIWAINEFPSTTRTGELDVWTHERDAVKGLAEGDGTTVRGVVFLSGMGQDLQNFSVYKANIENWFQQDAFWSDMNKYVRFFSYEVYADPHMSCVIGSNVYRDEAELDAYLMHIPQLALQGGAKTATAAQYLKYHYLPLVGAAWNSTVGFGDNVINIVDFEKFMRLQVYSTHVWAANHGYPGRRIGFAWSPKAATVDQENYLADVVARSVQRSYPANGFYGLGKYACSIAGTLDGCGCTVAGSYNPGWSTFSSW